MRKQKRHTSQRQNRGVQSLGFSQRVNRKVAAERRQNAKKHNQSEANGFADLSFQAAAHIIPTTDIGSNKGKHSKHYKEKE